MLELNAKTTALVVIDLQEGILPFAGGPHTADEVVNAAGVFHGEFASPLPLKCKSCSSLKIVLNSLSKDKNCLLHWV